MKLLWLYIKQLSLTSTNLQLSSWFQDLFERDLSVTNQDFLCYGQNKHAPNTQG